MSQQTFKHYQKLAKELEVGGLYSAEDEHDACGVGMVAAINGQPRRDVVRLAIDALKAVWHRGAVNADGKTGDGAGLLLQIPEKFFRAYIADFGTPIADNQKFAVGMVFLPRQQYDDQETSREIVEREIIRFGYRIHGWRQVSVNPAAIGDSANETRPEVTQIIIIGKQDELEDAFERNLYIIRKRIEKRVWEEAINGFHICSLSCRSIVYKGLFQAEQLESFYPDLSDTRFESCYAIFHQRFSTNTAPLWHLAQPFSLLAHNGEINTVKGNIQWMKSHEAGMAAESFGAHVDSIRPVIAKKGSDTAALNAAMELLIHGGRSLPLAKTILIPPAWWEAPGIPDSHKALFSYCNCIMSPWDGPAAIAACDGKWAIAGMDRNGLRPMRYSLTADGLLLVGSETGMVPMNRNEVLEYGHLGPGQMIGVDFAKQRVLKDYALKDALAHEHPYEEWVKSIQVIDMPPTTNSPDIARFDEETIRRRQIAAGQTMEDLEIILTPMVKTGKEAVGSMGDDTPIALLARNYRGLHQFFRQNFSQVTNPPIDSIREKDVMSLITRIGNKQNILSQGEHQTRLLLLKQPVLLSAELNALREALPNSFVELDVTYDAGDKAGSLRKAVENLLVEVDATFDSGKTDFLLTDDAVSETRVAIPMILAVSAVHAHLSRLGRRKRVSLLVRSGECMDTHHFAVLIGVGATAINPYLSESWIIQRHKTGLFNGLPLGQALLNYRNALSDGMLKIMAKMGISVISSYRGGNNFEAIGLSRSLVNEYFPGLKSRISGIGLDGIQNRVMQLHHRAYDHAQATPLPIGGFYNYRGERGEMHANEGATIKFLQNAVASGSYRQYCEYSALIMAQPPIHLRDLLDFKPLGKPIALDDVESVTDIRKRFVAPAMSMGALSPEAHETLAVAMNRMGAASNSGEGGESRERYHPRANGDNANSVIKQVASGRFGVTAEYLNNCREIQIKVAQGAKPGEGGQLPGFKVTELIAELRHATPGVTLISPPPHHDIYSIEDLAQLIYDLKQINPDAIVSVKLVSQSGIGTIASGVVKAMADKIVIAGHSGGTGASPQSSVKFAGAPFEMGLAETQQVLMLNRLRHRVKLQTDGGLRTGRDIVIAAILGAEEYAVGTMALVALGCLLVRQCHSNTCPVGICTQDEELRKKFEGNVERIINLFTFMAEEVREILAQLGAKSIEEIIGRPELLQQVNHGGEDLDAIDLGPLLVQPDQGDYPRHCTTQARNPVCDPLDVQMMKDAQEAILRGEKIELTYTINNTYRTIGARLSSMMGRQFELAKLQDDHITIRLRGSAGQSLGAFGVKGLKLDVSGDANDYVGKGLSGATIVVRPTISSTLPTQENTIIGNTCLYGATSGNLFAAGKAGERFAVRNSGALAIVEGCGTNGCEYMTGGTVIILGKIGRNFGAGMSGGMAFIYDAENVIDWHINPEMVVWQRLQSTHWEKTLKDAIALHIKHTHSQYAQNLLYKWEWEREKFWQICSKEMLPHLQHPLSDDDYSEAASVATSSSLKSS
ncbi:MAG: glutamate synthase large subunit [Alphaproteobacteria bacterium]|nr:glutamate synthase large subunit [Alphaproteobacteria bacterium]